MRLLIETDGGFDGITLTQTEEHILRTQGTVEQALLRMILAFEAIHGPKTQAAFDNLESMDLALQERSAAYGQDFGPDAIIAALRQHQLIDTTARTQAEQNLVARSQDAERAQSNSREATRIGQRFVRWRELITAMFEEDFHGTPIPPEVLEQLEAARRQPVGDDRLQTQFLTLAGYVLRQPAQSILELPARAVSPQPQQADHTILPRSPEETLEEETPESTPDHQDLTFQNWAEVFGDEELNATNPFVLNYITAIMAVRNRLPDFDTAIQEILDSAGISEPHQKQYRNMAAIEALVVVTPKDLKAIFHLPKSVNPMSRILALVYRKTFPAGKFASVDNFTALAVQIQSGSFDRNETLEDLVCTYMASLGEITYHETPHVTEEDQVIFRTERTDFPSSIPIRSSADYPAVLLQLSDWSRRTLSEKLRSNYQNRPFPNGCADGQLDLILKITKHIRDEKYFDILRKVCPNGITGRWTEVEALVLLVLHEGRQRHVSRFDRRTVNLLDDLKSKLEAELEVQ